MLRHRFPDRVRRYARRLDLPCDQFIDLEGEWTHYLHGAGAGTPVILLHGLMEWSFTWEAVLGSLAGRPYFAPDLRGFGWSEKTNRGAYDLTAQAQQILRLMDAWGLPAATLVGHSMGGEIALRIALLAPERVRSLVLVDAAGYITHKGAAVDRMLRWPRWFAHLALRATLLRRRHTRQSMQQVYHDPSRVTERLVSGYYAPSRLPGVIPTLRSLLGDADWGAWQDRYGEIRHAALLVWGAQDPLTPLAHGQRLAEELPQAELHVIADASHLPHEETPEQVRPLLARWLADPRH